MKVYQDKDFDGFFKSSFEDFEVTPSAQSWDKIAKELERKPTKKYPIFWIAAANVVIVLWIGIGLFTKPTEVIKLKGAPIQNIIANQEQNTKVEAFAEQIIASKTKVKDPIENIEDRVILASIDQKEINVQEEATTNELILPSRSDVLEVTNTMENLTRVRPARKIQSVAQQMIDEESIQNNINSYNVPKMTLAQNTIDENLSGNGANNGRKIKIKSVGDLVNFVVAQVDKRDDKIIKVSKTDESDNEITGINFGLFKFSKAER
jgi:hypothetical protein